MNIITTHINADFDALASMLAAKKFYPDALVVFPGAQEKSVRDFISSHQIPLDIKKLKDINLDDVRLLILVDTKNPHRIGRFSEILERKGLKIHIYDHHPFTADDIRGQKEIVESVGATATIFTEILKQKKIAITPIEATILCLGVYEETGSLTFSSTTERELMAVAYLLKKGANLNIVSSFISRELSGDEIELLNELIQSSRDYVIHGIRIKIAKASREHYLRDIAYLAHKIRDIENIDVLFLLVRMEDRIHIIARSRMPEVDAGEIAKSFGGGGHPTASSAILDEPSLENAEEKLLLILKQKIKPEKTARDIMTSPVKSIQCNSTVKDAEQLMTQYGVNVLPVMQGNSFFGLISREIVEKALFHGFAKNEVYEFSTTDSFTVTQQTPIREIESLMIEQNQRFMPVVEGEKIVGAITRTDLLRTIYEDLLRKSRLEGEQPREKPSMGKNLTSLLEEKFPEELLHILRLAGEVAETLGFSAYVVGGSVRDLLRGEANLDIDIVIEGDGITFAQAFGEELNARVKSHKRFGTAVVITPHAGKLDIATARTEYYEFPGALPKVEMSSIKKDLYRRDFTINTLAIKLNPRDFGQLLDFFGGQRDLREKAIRVLHNMSFIEDPTRAFRAIRFSERFGFKISKHTLTLIKTAVKMNLFEKLSGARLYDELNLLFFETEPTKAIKRLSEMNLLKFIHPYLSLTKVLIETFESLQETLTWFKLLFFEETPDKGSLFLMALIDGLKAKEQEDTLKRLNVPSREKENVIAGLRQSKEALQTLRVEPKETYYTLQPLSLEAILFAMAKAKEKEQKKAISLYLTELRKVKTAITGKDLRQIGYPPGPLYNKIFKEILDARLEGQIKSKEEEIRFVKEKFPI
ncbi:MAG TPA: hypothetical protein DEP99_02990 [Nitrospiraceae bacterium]|nr:hypothetical protein [Nitrospiraceae bacterium]